jgi:hypothetical protein
MKKLSDKIRLAFIILLPMLAFDVFSQTNSFTYFTEGLNKIGKEKSVDLKNLNAIIVKNNSSEAVDILFVLKGSNGKNLGEMNDLTRVEKDSSKTIKIKRDSLNKYLNLNQTLFIDEDISSNKVLQYASIKATVDNQFTGTLYPFQDALTIAEELRKKKRTPQSDSIINAILSHYQGVKYLTINQLHAFYSNNSFIVNNVYPTYAALPKAQAQSLDMTPYEGSTTTGSTPFYKALANSAGGLNATIVADAFAKIIIKRFKQDLNEIFFQRMKEEMDKNVELKTLLPRTYSGLSVMDKDIFQFNQFIEGLRQKMEEDLSNVFANTNDLLETDKYKGVFKENQTLRAFLTTVTQFSDGLIRKQHPSVVIDNLHFSDGYDYNEEGKNLKTHLQTLQLFSRGLRSSSGNWEQGLDRLNELFKNDAKACQIWLGLMHQLAVDDENQAFAYDNGQTLRASINKLYDKRNGFYDMETYVKGLIRRVNQINMSLESVNKIQENDSKVYWDKVITLYDNTISLVKFAPTISEIFDNQYVMPRNWYKGIYMAEILPHIYTEMQSRNYNAAVQHIASLIKASDFRDMYVENFKGPINAAQIYQIDSANSLIKTHTDLKGKYIKNPETGKFIQIKKLYYDSTLKTPVNTEGVDKFVKYSSFAASLVLAKTSDEVANLLETTMVPPGSTRMKEYVFLFGINSYLGLQYVDKEQNGTSLLSISAPIGLNFSVGIPRKPKYLMNKKERIWDFIKPHNVQAIFTLVDVGAIVGLRFSDSQADLPKIKLENIFSPGIILQFGRIFNSPLNIGIGYQSQPRLYGINGDMLSFQKNSFKLNFNLNWDIPLWNFWFKEMDRKN